MYSLSKLFFQISHSLYDQPGVMVLCFLYFDANFTSTDYWMWKPTKDFTFGLSESEQWITYQLLLMQSWKGKMVGSQTGRNFFLDGGGGHLKGWRGPGKTKSEIGKWSLGPPRKKPVLGVCVSVGRFLPFMKNHGKFQFFKKFRTDPVWVLVSQINGTHQVCFWSSSWK
jgi:hypothetical protein